MATKNEKASRRLVRERSNGICELCGSQRATNFQHRRSRAHAGPWSASNGLDVCGAGNASGCHGYIHQNPTEACQKGWTVKSWDDERAIAVQTVHGYVLLDDNGSYAAVADA